MIFRPTELPGAFVIDLEPHHDERGSFARTWCREEFEAHGLNSRLVQCGVSWNVRRGTLRGLHFQVPPHQEAKLVRCTRGAIYDVILDLRAESPTYKRWIGIELTPDNRRMLYIPEGFAHGFQTLADGTEVSYQLSEGYHPESARGVRWDDHSFGIVWPEGPRTMSLRDAHYADYPG